MKFKAARESGVLSEKWAAGRSTSQWQEKSYDSCCSTRFTVTWPWSADTEPVHRRRALLSRLVAPRNWSCTNTWAWSFSSLWPVCQVLTACVYVVDPPTSSQLQALCISTMHLNTKKPKCSEWRQYGSTAQYDFRRDCYVGGKTFPEIFF